jgi:hypothetical protein
MIRSPFRQRSNVVNFEIRLSVTAHKWCWTFAPLTVSSCRQWAYCAMKALRVRSQTSRRV